MKRVLICFCFIFLLNLIVVSAECIESDNGKDIYSKGYVIYKANNPFKNPEYTIELDTCIRGENTKISECYCDENELYGKQCAIIDCKYGCIDGACIDEEFIKYYPADQITSVDRIFNKIRSFCYENFCVIYSGENYTINQVLVFFNNIDSRTNQAYTSSGEILINQERKMVYDGEIIKINGRDYKIKTNFGNYIVFDSVISSFSQNPIKFNCTDSDSGLNIFKKGEVVYPDGLNLVDRCENNFIVEETFCLDDVVYNNMQTNYRNYYSCPLGTQCQDGACVRINSNSEIMPVFGFNIDTIKNETVSNENGSGVNCGVCAAKCDGCLDGKKCLSFGSRLNKSYCSNDGNFVLQSDNKISCENNFECKSNLCIDSQCDNSGFFIKIIRWFKNLFT